MLFVVWVVRITLGKRVRNAFVKDIICVVWPVGTLCTQNRVREAQIDQRSWQVVRVEFDIELSVYEMLYLLFILVSSFFFEHVEKTLSLPLTDFVGRPPPKLG